MTMSPSPAAERGTAAGRTGAGDPARTIGVLAPFLGGFYFGGVVAGAARAAAATRHPVLAVQTFPAGLDHGQEQRDPPHDGRIAAAQAHALRLADRSMSGIVVVSHALPAAGLERLHRLGKPVVLVSADVADRPAPTAAPDNVGGVRALVDHLVGHGHRRIGFVGDLGRRDIAERHHGYRQALLAHGITPRPEWVVRAADTLETGGRDAGRRLVRAGLPTTAVVAGTDRNAVGLIEAVRSHGVRVPAQLAVAGFDNTDAGARHSPPLTTVEPRFDLVGELATRLLVSRLRGGRVRDARHRTATTLVVRRSCGCPELRAAGVVPRPTAGTGRSGPPPAVLAVLEGAARDGDRPDAATLGRAARAHLAAVPHAERLTDVAAALRAAEARLAADAAVPAALRAAATDLLLTVLREHQRAGLRRQGELEVAAATQVEIGIELFRPGHPDPRRLRWLAGAPVTAACLGLFDDDRRLHVTGVHDPAGGLDRLVGTRTAPGEFPPAAFRQRAAGRAGEAVVVVPVSTERRDHGLLAVLGSVEHRATSVRDAYNHWATLLGVALDQDELVASARRQREDLERAVVRERELADSVRASEERYALVARATDDGLWDWDIASGVVYWSPRWRSMLGHAGDAADEIGDGPGEWLDRVHPDDREELAAAIAAQLGGSASPLEVEHRVRTAAGDHRWVLARALTVRDDAGYPVRMVGAFVDLADRKASEEQLSRGALHDAPTGLPTRALFLDRLGLALARVHREPGYDVALLVARVPGDDAALRAAAGRLTAALAPGDTAGRLGRDELGVILDDTGRRDVPAGTARLAAALGTAPGGGATCGVAPSGREHTRVADLLRAAEIALHRARAHGG